jgi:hypothetical protein
MDILTGIIIGIVLFIIIIITTIVLIVVLTRSSSTSTATSSVTNTTNTQTSTATQTHTATATHTKTATKTTTSTHSTFNDVYMALDEFTNAQALTASADTSIDYTGASALAPLTGITTSDNITYTVPTDGFYIIYAENTLDTDNQEGVSQTSAYIVLNGSLSTKYGYTTSYVHEIGPDFGNFNTTSACVRMLPNDTFSNHVLTTISGANTALSSFVSCYLNDGTENSMYLSRQIFVLKN